MLMAALVGLVAFSVAPPKPMRRIGCLQLTAEIDVDISVDNYELSRIYS